jgi:acyl-coenzyme A synthetase/AMP-(fatty) acid ligase
LCSSRIGFLVTSLAAWRSQCEQMLPPSGGNAELLATLSSCVDPIVVVDDAQELQRHGPLGTRSFLHVPELPTQSMADADLAWSPERERPLVRLFTSGSTGTPEPHAKTLAQLVRGARALASRLEQDVDGGLAALRQIICSVAPQHMFGLETSVMLPLVFGMPVLERRPLLPADVTAAFERCTAAGWIATPVHLRALVESAAVLRSCRVVIASTMPLAPTLASQAESLVAAPILEIYGSTETGAIAMRRTAQTTDWRPLGDVRFEPATHGTVVWGAHFTSPQTLADQTEADGRGGVRLLGRHADLIKIAGRRTSLANLNLLLQDLPGLADGVFYLPPAAAPTERLVLIYAGARLDRASAIAWLRQRIDPVFLPRVLIHVERLPRTDSGKLPRAALDAVFAAWRDARTRCKKSGQ